MSEIAAELGEAPAPIAYHLRVLVRLGALKARARSRPAPALFRWSPEAHWARKMLDEIDAHGSENG